MNITELQQQRKTIERQRENAIASFDEQLETIDSVIEGLQKLKGLSSSKTHVVKRGGGVVKEKKKKTPSNAKVDYSTTKTCSACHEKKTLGKFKLDKSSSDGRSKNCRFCTNRINAGLPAKRPAGTAAKASKPAKPPKADDDKPAAPKAAKLGRPAKEQKASKLLATPEKECIDCHLPKVLDAFAKDPASIDGHVPTCKLCVHKQHRIQQAQAEPEPTSKVCFKCREDKPIDHFAKVKDLPGGRARDCNECVEQLVRKWQDPQEEPESPAIEDTKIDLPETERGEFDTAQDEGDPVDLESYMADARS